MLGLAKCQKPKDQGAATAIAAPAAATATSALCPHKQPHHHHHHHQHHDHQQHQRTISWPKGESCSTFFWPVCLLHVLSLHEQLLQPCKSYEPGQVNKRLGIGDTGDTGE
ncbi:hypothetical protein ACLKA6_003605 [Drosophila palustris]